MDHDRSALTSRQITETWWPLAASWLLMAVEGPLVASVVARLADPEIHLAALGGIIFPLLLLIESPVIMMLAASTALSRNWPAYLRLRSYMMTAGAVLTVLHVLIAFTPLYDFVVVRMIGVPEAIVEPGRIGVMLAIPWTWPIAHRRFNQGILIRFGATQIVGLGTVVRLVASALVLAVGYATGTGPGAAVGSLAMVVGVVCEAAFIEARTRPIRLQRLQTAAVTGDPVTLSSFSRFYVPLALTSLLALLLQPLGSAAMSRMPMAIESLASWPIVIGLLFMLRSGGIAYKEVVVAMLDRPNPLPALRRFTMLLGATTLLFTVLIAAPSVSTPLFMQIAGLPKQLGMLASYGLLLGLPTPLLGVLQNWYVGVLVHGHRTQAVTESMVLFLVVCFALLVVGATWTRVPGLLVAQAAFTLGHVAQLAWVWWKSQGLLTVLNAADPAGRVA